MRRALLLIWLAGKAAAVLLWVFTSWRFAALACFFLANLLGNPAALKLIG